MLSKDYLSYQYLLHVLLSLSKTSLYFEVCPIVRKSVLSSSDRCVIVLREVGKIFKKRRLNTDFILDKVSNLKRQFLGHYLLNV